MVSELSPRGRNTKEAGRNVVDRIRMAWLLPLVVATILAGRSPAEDLFRPDHPRPATRSMDSRSDAVLVLRVGEAYPVLERSRRGSHVRVAHPSDPNRVGWVRFSPTELRTPEPGPRDARYSSGWAGHYRAVADLRDGALEKALRAANRNMWTLGYDSARDVMFSQIDNAGGEVRCVYTGLMFRAGKRPGVRPGGVTMNTEHTWPQSDFDKREPMRSDLHHLFPTETESNGVRSSKAFDELGDKEGQAVGGLGARTTEDAFEPPAAHKGNVARAMLYFAVQHRRDIPQATEKVLRRWHREDPVDDAERRRNQLIYQYQLSRNPFVDHPELVGKISDY